MLFSKLLQLMLYYLTAKMKRHFQYQLFQNLFHHCEILFSNSIVKELNKENSYTTPKANHRIMAEISLTW